MSASVRLITIIQLKHDPTSKLHFHVDTHFEYHNNTIFLPKSNIKFIINRTYYYNIVMCIKFNYNKQKYIILYEMGRGNSDCVPAYLDF